LAPKSDHALPRGPDFWRGREENGGVGAILSTRISSIFRNEDEDEDWLIFLYLHLLEARGTVPHDVRRGTSGNRGVARQAGFG
jgi:hypothetical protein